MTTPAPAPTPLTPAPAPTTGPATSPPNPARQYGRHYGPAIDLTVGEFAALIMADLISIAVHDEPDAAHLLDPDTYIPMRIRFAAEVYPRHDTIRIMVHGLADTELDHPYATPSDDSPCPFEYPEIVETVANAYGWTNPGDPDDRRFLMRVVTLTEDEQARDEDRVGEVRMYPHSVPPWLMSAAPAATGLDDSADV